MANYTTAAEAVKLIRPHDHVYIQGSTSIPEVLVQAMTDRGPELRGVKVYSAFAVGAFEAPYCKPEFKDTFLVNSLFVANNIRRWLAQGYGQTIPAFLGEIPGLFRSGLLPVDVAILNVSRPNADGYCSYGVSADLAVPAVECAKTVIAQVNAAMPFSYGDALIHISKIDAAVEVDEPLVELPTCPTRSRAASAATSPSSFPTARRSRSAWAAFRTPCSRRSRTTSTSDCTPRP